MSAQAALSTVPANRGPAGEVRVKVHTAAGEYLGRRSIAAAERAVTAGLADWENDYLRLRDRSGQRVYPVGPLSDVHRNETETNVCGVWAFRRRSR
ncbi:MAG: hypothetical protein ACRD6B_03265 [Bryobacteraceae bacterium]